MKQRALLSLLVAAMTFLFAGGAVALLADNALHEPTNYDSTPPRAGRSYVDPVFGTTITRVSDATSTDDAAGAGSLPYVMTEYSTMSAFNDDGSRFILQHGSYYALYSGTGKYLGDLPLQISASTEPRWARTDPRLLYFLDGNQLFSYDIGTERTRVAHTFFEYDWITGNGESDIGFQRDRFVLVGNGEEIFVFDVGSSEKSPVLSTGGRAFDSIYLTPDGNVLVSWLEQGSSRRAGIELYDQRMNFVRQITTVGGHMDVSRDSNGDEVLLWTNAADPAPKCDNAVVKVRLSDAHQTCLISLDWTLAVNVSASDGDGWVYVATYAPSDPLPGSSGWKTYTNELLKVRLDGGRVERLAHHRSRPFNGYNYTPRPTVSRDGSRLAYSSNFGLQEEGYPTEYSDAYLIDLAGGSGGDDDSGTGGDSADTVERLEETRPRVRFRGGEWFDNESGLHSGGKAKMSMDRGARAVLRFHGTGVRWIGYEDQWSGIAVVKVDGKKRRVDTYANPANPQAVIHEVTGLRSGRHRIVIRVEGRHSRRSGGSWVWVDAMEILR